MYSFVVYYMFRPFWAKNLVDITICMEEHTEVKAFPSLIIH